jgi:hypothetical protein
MDMQRKCSVGGSTSRNEVNNMPHQPPILLGNGILVGVGQKFIDSYFGSGFKTVFSQQLPILA